MATELAKAYVQIVPSAQGLEGSISGLMNGEAGSAGKSAGQSFASNFGGIAKKAIAALGVGKIIADGIANTSEFETAMAKASTLFTGTSEEFSELQQRIMNVSNSTGMAATMLAEAAYSAESASVPMELLGDMIESSTKLAVAGYTDVDTALSATAKTMNAYGMTGSRAMEQVQKVLIQTQNYGITTVGELGASLANVTPTAAAMGVSFEQVGASLALMTARGVPTAQATTQLRAAMTELGKSGTKANDAFREAAKGTKYADMSFQEAISSGANLGDIFSLMQAYADASGLSMVDLWSSVEAGNAAMLIAGDVKTFNSDLKAMSSSADVVEDSYGKMSGTLGQSMSRLKESAKNFMTTLFTGGDISSSFDTMLSNLGDVGERLIGWMTTGLGALGENLPALMGSLLDFGAGLLNAIGSVNWIELGTTIITGIVGAIGELGVRLAEAMGTAVKAVTTGEVDFASIGTAVWNGVTSVITTAGDWLSEIFKTAASAAAGVDFTGIGSKILEGVKAFIDGAGGFLSALFESGETAAEGVGYGGIGSKILEGVTGSIDSAGTFLSSLFGSGKTAAEGVGYSGIGAKILAGVTGSIDSAGAFLSDLFEKGKTASEGLSWETVSQAVKTGVDLILSGGEFLSSCFSAGADLVKAMDWGAIGTAVSNGLTGTIDAAGQFLSGCFESGKALIEGMDWGAIGTAVSNGLTGTIDAAGQFLSGCFESGKALIEGMDWGAIGTSISNGVTGMIDAGGQFLSGCFESGKALVEGIEWSAIGTSISNGITGTIDAGGQFLSGCFESGKALIEGMEWSAIGTSISNGLTGVIDAGGEFLAAPFRAAKSLIEGIDWASVGSAISSGLGDVWSGFTGFLGGALSGAGDVAAGVGSGIGEAASAAGEGIANWIRGGDGLSKQIETLQNNMTELKKAVETGKTDAEKAAKEVSKAIKEGLKSDLGASAMKDIGSSIITGIISGITETSGALYEKLRQVARSALAAAKAALQVGSPSRVMRDEVGKWIPAGIAAGIDSGAGMVTDAMRRMTRTNIGNGIAEGLAAQGRSMEAAAEYRRAGGSGTAEIVGAIQEMRNDLQNLRLVVGTRTFGRAVVDYGGRRVEGYIGQAESSLAGGYGT